MFGFLSRLMKRLKSHRLSDRERRPEQVVYYLGNPKPINVAFPDTLWRIERIAISPEYIQLLDDKLESLVKMGLILRDGLLSTMGIDTVHKSILYIHGPSPAILNMIFRLMFLPDLRLDKIAERVAFFDILDKLFVIDNVYVSSGVSAIFIFRNCYEKLQDLEKCFYLAVMDTAEIARLGAMLALAATPWLRDFKVFFIPAEYVAEKLEKAIEKLEKDRESLHT